MGAETKATDALSAVAALDEPTRRRIYEHVARQPAPASRDEVAAALRIPRTTAAFHLDRLVRAGLLDAAYERRGGRSGPGAGRPAKLYHRSAAQVAVSLPERRYDLAGSLLAGALDEADRTGEAPRAVLDRHARDLGAQLGRAARGGGRAAAVRTLEEHGFEPRVEGGDVALGNCPFHSLAEQHPALVCGMNLCLLEGLLDGLGTSDLRARLAPAAGHCCVRLEA